MAGRGRKGNRVLERFIIRYRGAGPRPPDLVERIRALEDASIVESTDRMLLVEANEDQLRNLLGSSKDWLVAPVRGYELPEHPPRIKK
jgi:hypothetical protein